MKSTIASSAHVDLNHELCLDAAGGLALVVASRAAERVHLSAGAEDGGSGRMVVCGESKFVDVGRGHAPTVAVMHRSSLGALHFA